MSTVLTYAKKSVYIVNGQTVILPYKYTVLWVHMYISIAFIPEESTEVNL